MSNNHAEAGPFREPFSCGNTSLGFLAGRPAKIQGGLLLVCEGGEATVSIDVLRYGFGPDQAVILLPGSILSLESANEDFSLRFFYFCEQLFDEATFRLRGDFFKFIKENPVMPLLKKDKDFVDKWSSLVFHIDGDDPNAFSGAILKNLLQCFFWECCEKMRRYFTHPPKRTKRQDEIFHGFMTLVKQHCRENRDVEFYARKLFISPRYLSYVCTHCANNLSAKRLIDLRTIIEIKILLETTSYPVQQIAQLMRFPDQSYFGRFFKRYTGLSPLEYRFRTKRRNTVVNTYPDNNEDP